MGPNLPVKKLNSDIRLIGAGSLLTPFNNQNSASRVQMATQQTSQVAIPENPDIPFVLHGMEQQMGLYAMNVTMPCNATIVRIIRSNERMDSHNRQKAMSIVYQNFDTGEFGILDVPTYRSTQDTFGYPLVLTDEGKSLRTGNTIRKGTIIAKTPGLREGGIYSNTLNLNVLNISLPHVIEDGFLISEEVAERAAPYYVVKHRISWGKKTFPVNSYGDDKKHKAFPDKGEKVRDDGLLVATRKYDDLFDAITMHNDNLQQVDTVHDRKIYVEPGAEVIDIHVIDTTDDKRGKPDTPIGMEKQARRYYEQSVNRADNLIAWFNENRRGKFEPHLQRSISDAYGTNPNAPDRRKVRQTYREKICSVKRTTKKQPLDEITVEITLGYRKKLRPGAKLASFHGCKGVVVAISPNDKMPVDEFGNRADICMFSRSVIARMNTGQLSEQYINAVRRDVRLDILELLKQGKEKDAWGMLINFYKIASPKLYEKLKVFDINTARAKKHLTCIVNGDIYLTLPSDGSWSIKDVYKACKKFRPPNKGKVKVISFEGKEIWSKANMLIGMEAFMVLEKTSHKPFACATASRNNFGLPATTNKATKHATPVNHNPPRWWGESEVRGISHNVGGDFVTELLDYTTNPETAEAVVKTLFGAKNPALVEKAVDRNEIPLGNDRASGMITHLLDCYGVTLAESDIPIYDTE